MDEIPAAMHILPFCTSTTKLNLTNIDKWLALHITRGVPGQSDPWTMNLMPF